MSDKEHLEVVDTEGRLTKDEVKELKALAQMSKTAKWFIATGIALVSLFGMDKLAAWFDHK